MFLVLEREIMNEEEAHIAKSRLKVMEKKKGKK